MLDVAYYSKVGEELDFKNCKSLGVSKRSIEVITEIPIVGPIGDIIEFN